MKKVIAAASLAALAGCAPHVMFNAPNGQAAFYRDKLDCAEEANAIVGGYAAVGAPLFVAAAAQANNNAKFEATKECMLGKGYIILKEWRGPNTTG